DAHEAGHADDVGTPALEDFGQRLVKCETRGKIALGEAGGRDAFGAGDVEAGCGGAVGEDANDLSGIIGRLGGLNQRAHVRASARNQDGDAFLATHRARAPVNSTASPVRSISPPTIAAVSPWLSSFATSASASSAATATSMPTPQ